MPKVGEYQAIKLTAFFQVPWEMPESRVDLNHYLQKFVERKQKEGWRFHKILNVWREPTPFVREKQLVREYTIEAVFGRPARPLNLEVPDHVAKRLMHKYPGRFSYR